MMETRPCHAYPCPASRSPQRSAAPRHDGRRRDPDLGAPAAVATHTTVQAAVNAANAAAGADEISIARSATWTAQRITINTAEELSLVGGYATCTSSTSDATFTTLSGAGGDARPVLTIRGDGFVSLRRLTIRDGDQAGDDHGGGINFAGGGILDISDSLITANTARDGAGIYATGTTITAEVILRANVSQLQMARNSGGGMVSKSLETSITGPARPSCSTKRVARTVAATAEARRRQRAIPVYATSLQWSGRCRRAVRQSGRYGGALRCSAR